MLVEVAVTHHYSNVLTRKYRFYVVCWIVVIVNVFVMTILISLYGRLSRYRPLGLLQYTVAMVTLFAKKVFTYIVE